MQSGIQSDVIVLIAACYVLYQIGYPYLRKKRWTRKKFKYDNVYTYPWFLIRQPKPDLSDPDVAIKFVQANSYSIRPIMNKGAYQVFRITERYFKEINQGHRVIPEMCMGAVLQCSNQEGFSSINSKRLDIGVINQIGNLILAIEYNGSGHYQGNASGRDAVKRMALNKARVPLIEIIPDDDDARIIEKLKRVSGIKN